MAEITYNPDNVGKEIVNSRGKVIRIRKYYLTPTEMEKCRKKWLIETTEVDKRIKKKAGKIFFNPYRKGIYYYQIQALFLLGANKWHSLAKVIKKIEKIMSTISLSNSRVSNTWEKFKGKSERSSAIRCKDYIGRIQENMIMFQRLTQLHPYGYKLYQVYSTIDIKRVSRSGVSKGLHYYRLRTCKEQNEALPIRDYTKFQFPKHKKKYISYKFIGTILTKDKTMRKGVSV